jgi:RNA polymerase sigma factor (sigma-70 family)
MCKAAPVAKEQPEPPSPDPGASVPDPRSDDELALQAGGETAQEALHALALRHLDWMYRRVAREASDSHLAHEDVCDAQQRAFFVLLRVVGLFDKQRRGGTGRPTFRSFLGLRLSTLVRNLARQLRRLEKYRDRSPVAARILRGDLADAAGSQRREEIDDPAVLAERGELAERLREAVRRLPTLERWVVEGRLAGNSLCALAKQAGVSYYRLKYAWRQAKSQLADGLQDLRN